MGKTRTKKRGPRSTSKAQAIRDEFGSQGPAARPKDVIATLKEKGINVSSAQVSNIKATLGKGKRRKLSNGRGATDAISLDALLEAKKLVDRLGGVEVAKHALDALSRLT